MTYLFDTNILLHFLRESPLSRKIEDEYSPFHPANVLLLSVVSLGEIHSIALQNKWGKRRTLKLENDLKDFAVIPVRARDIIERYAGIDAFSQGKLTGKTLGVSSRNMGKNDLWIAATASVTGATLLSTDADFDHLNKVFLDVLKFVP